MKLLINVGIGGFSLSEKAIRRLAQLGCKEAQDTVDDIDRERRTPGSWVVGFEQANPHYVGTYRLHDVPRHDPLLLQVFEELGEEMDGEYANLALVEVPDDVKVYIHESESGWERVHEAHRVWYVHEDKTVETRYPQRENEKV